MDMYAKYLMERQGKHLLVSEGKGFATYEYQENHCYIEDIYVEPEFRKQKIASHLADVIAISAKAKGYNKLLGSVCPSTKGSQESLLVLLSYGFKLLSSQDNLIYLEKEI